MCDDRSTIEKMIDEYYELKWYKEWAQTLSLDVFMANDRGDKLDTVRTALYQLNDHDSK